MNPFHARDLAAASLSHGYGFDPRHGSGLEDLLKQTAPEEPADFAPFWTNRYKAVQGFDPRTVLTETGQVRGAWRVFDWTYCTTGNEMIRGWVLLPCSGQIKQGLLISHGYAGRWAPDFDLEFKETALFFPCLRGLGISRSSSVPANVDRHVLHNIQSRNDYVLGGCVEDIWVGVSSILHSFPQLVGHLGYLGISFGGGIGALSLPWESRVQRMHLNVPTFGNNLLRLKPPSIGSAASLQRYASVNPKVMDVLSYYDAALAARHIKIPVHCACALFDPSVAPAGQFAIYNAIPEPKQLYVLTAGHHSYPSQTAENRELTQEVYNFFTDI